MANQINPKTGGDFDKINRTEPGIKYTSNTLSSPRSQQKPIDDVIVALANAHENRRARQVTKWELMTPHNFHFTS